ncbi:MAG: SUMF1/EgtB/PvdO family nonheme iron enzyme [Minisyncoccales bacterium]
MKKLEKDRSFTLIELLVVIVIIGILAGVIAISTSSAITSSQNAKLAANLSNISKALEGYSSYPKDSFCIEDTAKNPNFLSSLGIENYPKHPNYTNGTALTTNDCFLYFSDGQNYSIRTPAQGNNGYLIQESRHPKTQDIVKSCESGWIPFGNRCIMQYEAKAKSDADSSIDADGVGVSIGSYSPASVSEGQPWRSISQIDAKKACEKIGAHLITNAEWMAIARDIEQVKSNWTGGSIGSGMIKRGNVGIVDAGSYNGADPEAGITNDLAKLTLSNGKQIYHFSGNVWEWVDDKIECGVSSCPSILMPYDSTPASEWVEFTSVNTWGKYTKAELGPLGNYNSANGVGKIYTDYDAAAGSSDTYTHAFRRGGRWSNGADAGVFALSLLGSPADLDTFIGFRCAR